MLDWRDPAVKRVFVLMVPVTLGLGLINVNAVIDTFFASRLIDPNLAPTAIQKAFLIYMLPQGMFSVAIATVLFPTLSPLRGARGDIDGLPRHGEQRSAPDRVPAHPRGGGERGARRADRPASSSSAATSRRAQTPVVAAALAAFSAGLVFNGAMLMLNRAFFSLQSNWVPTAIALGNLFLNAILDFVLYPRRVGDPALDGDLQRRRNVRRCFVLLRRRLGRLDGGAIAATVAEGLRCVGRRRRGRVVRLAPARRTRSAARSPRRSSRSGPR